MFTYCDKTAEQTMWIGTIFTITLNIFLFIGSCWKIFLAQREIQNGGIRGSVGFVNCSKLCHIPMSKLNHNLMEFFSSQLLRLPTALLLLDPCGHSSYHHCSAFYSQKNGVKNGALLCHHARAVRSRPLDLFICHCTRANL
jgi:hypothetical protein